MDWNVGGFFAFMSWMLTKAHLLVTRFPFSSRWGGEELHTLRLMQALEKRGFEPFFLGSDPVLLKAFQENGFGTQKAWLGKAPVTKFWFLCFTLLSPFLFFKAAWLLWRARQRWGVDTLYALSLGEKILMTPWAHIFGMKILWLEHARIGNWLKKNPWRWVYTRLSTWCTVVVTSKAMLTEMGGLAKQLVAIPCGVIVDKMAPLPEDMVQFLKGGFAVGTVARLTVDKGVDMMVRLVHSKPDMRLILVGEGPLKDQLIQAAPKGRVLFVDSLPRPQLMSLYKALDLFVLPSTQMDPFGMVAAEAMWFGTPVLLTDQCGFAKALHNGKEAVIVPARFAALDKAVKKLMRDPEKLNVLGKAGKDLVHLDHSFKDMVKDFERLLIQ